MNKPLESKDESLEIIVKSKNHASLLKRGLNFLQFLDQYGHHNQDNQGRPYTIVSGNEIYDMPIFRALEVEGYVEFNQLPNGRYRVTSLYKPAEIIDLK